MAKHYDKQFKLDAVQYYHDHKNVGLQGCATNLGISQQTLSRWQKELRETVIICHQTIMKSCIVDFSKTNCSWHVKMRKTSF